MEVLPSGNPGRETTTGGIMNAQTVGEMMVREVVYLPAETPVFEAARTMSRAQIGDVVVTDGPMLSGMVTDRDIVVRAVARQLDPRRTTIGAIANRELIMIRQDASPGEAAKLMCKRAIRRLLVCDADRRLVGIISLSDLARA
jgi:CBS domain-containing protein